MTPPHAASPARGEGPGGRSPPRKTPRNAVSQKRTAYGSPRQIPAHTSTLRESIKQAAWQQIAEQGAPALSLRAIARALGITAPAIYNHYPDRDALVTVLIVDASSSFGDAQLAARDALPADDLLGRVHGMVSLEIGNHLPPLGPDGAALYACELENIKRQFIVPGEGEPPCAS